MQKRTNNNKYEEVHDDAIAYESMNDQGKIQIQETPIFHDGAINMTDQQSLEAVITMDGQNNEDYMQIEQHIEPQHIINNNADISGSANSSDLNMTVNLQTNLNTDQEAAQLRPDILNNNNYENPSIDDGRDSADGEDEYQAEDSIAARVKCRHASLSQSPEY